MRSGIVGTQCTTEDPRGTVWRVSGVSRGPLMDHAVGSRSEGPSYRSQHTIQIIETL